MLVEKGCLFEEPVVKSNIGRAFTGLLKKQGLEEISMEKMQKKMTKGDIDIEYLNQTLKNDCEYVLEDEGLFIGDN